VNITSLLFVNIPSWFRLFHSWFNRSLLFLIQQLDDFVSSSFSSWFNRSYIREHLSAWWFQEQLPSLCDSTARWFRSFHCDFVLLFLFNVRDSELILFTVLDSVPFASLLPCLLWFLYTLVSFSL
jgi:hypothetical protein